jgi:D-3-phosphoglycerate dehydrogenase
MNRILITEWMPEDFLNAIKELGEVSYFPDLYKSPILLRQLLHNKNILIVRNKTNVDKDLIESADGLEMVGRYGSGVDNIDTMALSEKNIKLAAGHGGNADSVAEHTIGMLIALSRKLNLADKHVKSGGWKREGFVGREINGKTLGIVGLGQIGSRVAMIAQAFGMNVLTVRLPSVKRHEFAGLYRSVQVSPLGNLLKQSDFVSLHLPLTVQTYHLISEAELKMMKRCSFLINTSRGGIIDEDSLYSALSDEWIAGAALDVLEEEPPINYNRFAGLDNVILTPHIAAFTNEAQNRIGLRLIQDIENLTFTRL